MSQDFLERVFGMVVLLVGLVDLFHWWPFRVRVSRTVLRRRFGVRVQLGAEDRRCSPTTTLHYNVTYYNYLQYYSINTFNNHQQQRNQPLFEHAFQYPWHELKISLVHVWYQNHFPVYASMAPHFQDKLCTAQGMCFYKMFNQLT